MGRSCRGIPGTNNPPPARDLHLLTAVQLYHSIHAKGENVEDVLRAAADEEGSGQAEPVEAGEQMETGGESPVVVPTAVPVEGAQVCIYFHVYPILLRLIRHRKQQNHIHNNQERFPHHHQGQRQQQSRVPAVQQQPRCLIRLWHLVSSSFTL